MDADAAGGWCIMLPLHWKQGREETHEMALSAVGDPTAPLGASAAERWRYGLQDEGAWRRGLGC